jgi:hypothetical protein
VQFLYYGTTNRAFWPILAFGDRDHAIWISEYEIAALVTHMLAVRDGVTQPTEYFCADNLELKSV